MDELATPKTAKEQIDSAAPASATVQRYDDNRRFFNAASGGRIFEWVKHQLRPVSLPQPSAMVQKSQSAPRITEPGHND
jgi:hypothetical protein